MKGYWQIKNIRNIHFSPNLTSANFLGLGWAATPAGLKAMESLAELEEERRKAAVNEQEANKSGADSERARKNRAAQNTRKRQRPAPVKAMPRGTASNEMCTFLILNISSLQLIPVNVIAYRGQYGSVNPTAIVAPGILATAVSTAVSVVFCKMMDRKRRV